MSTFNGGDEDIKPSRRRLPSFSSSSPLSSNCSSLGSASSTSLNNSPFSSSPLLRLMIPFSWEHCPGIPKTQLYNRMDRDPHPSLNLLPLPPAVNIIGDHTKSKKNKKKTAKKTMKPDPFLAAMVECSKNEDGDHIWKGSKAITRSLSDPFGFIAMYNSCKRTCPVSESIIHYRGRHPSG